MSNILKPNWNIIRQINFNTCNQGNIYQKLHLNNIGLNIKNFNLLRLSFNNLPIDKNYPKNLEIPTRFRRYSNFTLNVINQDMLCIKQTSNNKFSQNVDDFRKNTRVFTKMEDKVINDTFFQLMTQIVGLTLFSNPKIKKNGYFSTSSKINFIS